MYKLSHLEINFDPIWNSALPSMNSLSSYVIYVVK